MSFTIDERGGTIGSDPLRNFRFQVEFTSTGQFDDRIVTKSATTMGSTNGKSGGFFGGFMGVGGLTITVDSIPYREGGYNTTVHNIPGQARFSPITLSRGALYGNDQAITWMRGLFAAVAGEGLSLTTAGNSNFRCDVKIWVMDHPNSSNANTPKMAFVAKNAWISSIGYSDLDAGGNAIVVENMTLVHEGLSMVFTEDDGTSVEPDYMKSLG